jgi:WD40 repeat protein
MAVPHPSVEKLTAFTLGKLDEKARAPIEVHVASCTSCQERAANAPGDSFVELLRSAYARTSREADTIAEAAAQVQTPVSFADVAGTEAPAPAVTPAAPAESGRPEIGDAIPPELARHARYRVVRLLGSGGMGEVYEAQHLVMQRPVALKVIRRAYTAKADALDRFRREVHNAARLSHPNIVATHDAEDAGETHFLVMEYVEGTDLGRLVQDRGPLRVDRACDYVCQAALGLQYAFEQGMVHRDLKPHNLMVTPSPLSPAAGERGRGEGAGCVKILDFGLARFASETATGAGMTGTGLVLGTVDYIAPEQADNAHQADIRSDIYSLGCTLYHLLAGQPPFPTGTSLQKVMAHVEKKPQPLTELRPGLPEKLMPVIERMMAKNPKHRYQTPLEVALALERFTRVTARARAPQPPVPARRAKPGRTKETPVRDRRRTWLAIAAGLLAFVTAGLLGAAVYRIATDKGELVITSESDDVKVVITQGGKQVDVIDAKTDKQIRLALRSGEYELELKGAPEGLKLDIDRATLKRGDTVLATIRRETTRAAASKYLTLPIDKVASAVSTKSLFSGAEQVPSGPERLVFPSWGKQEVLGIPFDVIDPKGDSVKNAIVLYGPKSPLVREMPQTVKLKCGSPAKTIHLLSGVSGWGWGCTDPEGNKKTVSVIVRLHYRDGGKEDQELINGVHFCDYGGGPNKMLIDVPGSQQTPIRLVQPDNDTVTQIRYLAIKPKDPTKDIEEIEFIKGMRGDVTAPVIMAVTVERPGPWGMDGGEALTPKPPAAKRPPDGVVAWWRADGDAKDSVGDHHGTLKGGVTFAPGVAGQSFHLDGATRYVEVPRSDRWGFGRRDFSIELWVQFRGAATSNDIYGPGAVFVGCDEGNGGSGNKWFFAYGGGFLNFHINHANAGGDFYAKAAFEPDLEQWYHLAVTRSESTFTIYMNGAPVASQKVDVIIPNPNAPLTIGQAEGLGFFSGLMDEVAIYDRALSADEVKARWSALAPATKPINEKVGEVRRFLGHTADVHCVAYSPDGRYAVSCSGWPTWDCTIRVWDVSTGKQVRKFDSLEGKVLCAAFSPDGRRILYGSDHTAFLLDVGTGKEVQRFVGHVRNGINAVTFSPSGRQVLSAGSDGTARVWDADTGKELRKFEGHRERVIQALFSPDGKRALSGALDDTIYLWDVETGEKVQSFEGNKGGVHTVAISPDGRYVLCGSNDKPLRLWEVATGKLVREFIGHEAGVRRVAFSNDGCRAISCGADKTVRLWDVATGKELHCFTGHTDMVWGVAFSPDDRYGLSASQDKTLRLWRLPDPPPDRKSAPPAEKVGEVVRRFPINQGGVNSVAISPNGKLAATGSDFAVRLWDMADGREIRRMEGHGSTVTGVAFSPDGKLLASSGSHDQTVRIWEVATGKELHCLRGHNARVEHVAFLPDGGHVVSGGYDGTLRMWDVKTGKQVRMFEGHKGPVEGVAVSPDGRRVASGSQDGTARIWNAETGEELRQFPGHSPTVYWLAFSPDGRRLLSAEHGRTTFLWDVESGKELRQFVGRTPRFAVWTVFTTDGRRALSSGDDGIHLWDVETGKELYRIAKPAGGIAVSPDGHHLLFGDPNGAVLWRLPDPPPIGIPAVAPAIEDSGPVLTGKVILEGDKPDIAKLDEEIHKAMKARDEVHRLAAKATEDEKSQQTWRIDNKGGVGNVFVWIAPPRGQNFKVDMRKKTWPEKVVIDQPHCAFVPHAVVVFPKYRDEDGTFHPTGQSFNVENSADINHNVNFAEGGVNNIMPGHAKNPLVVELQPGKKPVPIKCNIHPWMTAYALALDHPFAAISKSDGTFKIENVPTDMEVTIFAWHEEAGFVNEGGAKGQKITLKHKTEVNFKLRAQ